jgi:phosphoserine phosphatase
MTYVLTLIADPAAAALQHSIVGRVRDALAAAGIRASPADWLAPDIACDIALADAMPAPALAAARAALGDAPIDAAVVPAHGRRKKLLVADMESTLIANEMLDELAARAGIGPQIADITRRAMNGELDFVAALRERVRLLAGQPATRLAEVAAAIAVTPGAKPLIATMRAHGAYSVIVSGGFRYFTNLLRERLGADADQGNELEIAGDVLTGEVRNPVLGKDAKLSGLKRHAAERGVSLSETLAVGDGANDVPMLLAAGLGVAFRAKPIVTAAVATRIEHADLTALLYLQGYRRDEFAA